MDLSLPDEAWFAASEHVYDETWRDHVGSPETFAAAGRAHLGRRNFAVAVLFFRKSIDLLHTLYTYEDLNAARRRPSSADLDITSGFVESLEAALGSHPTAPVAESVREATHRLRTISSACRRADVPADLYLKALQSIAAAAPFVNVDDVLW